MKKLKKTKVSQSKTIARSRAKDRPTKVNITFRIREDLLESFDKICTRAEVKKVTVIEDLIEQFVKSNK